MHLIYTFPESLHPIQNRPQLNPHLPLIILGQPFCPLRHHLLGNCPKIGLETNRQLLLLLPGLRQTPLRRLALGFRPHPSLPGFPALRLRLYAGLLLLLGFSPSRLNLTSELADLARKIGIGSQHSG